MQCVSNTLFLTLEQVFGRIRSLSVFIDLHSCSQESFMHEHFLAPQEVTYFPIATGKNCHDSVRLQGISIE